ncbi:MAG: hypothetical protein Q7T03_09530 [Deltaproteobacteria bacterium]|nr:hypothetical protein [Deltaproteobacteria bacterium]
MDTIAEMKRYFSFIALFCLMQGCGGSTTADGVASSGAAATVSIVVDNPNISDSSTGKSVGKSVDVAVNYSPVEDYSNMSVSKAVLSSLAPSTCTLTFSGADFTTFTASFSLPSGASSVTATLPLTAGSSRTICVSCPDSSGTTNGIEVGYNACTTTDLAAGANSVSMSTKFLNMITDDTSVLNFARINQESSSQTKIQLAFGSVLTDAQKTAMKCIVELDRSGSGTSFGSIDPDQSNGFTSATTGSRPNPYFLITGGVSRPVALFYDQYDYLYMRPTAAWSTTDSGNTMAVITYGITQNKTSVDTDQKGQWAVLCSLTGVTPWDRAPNSGYAKFDLSPNTNISTDTIASDGGSCTEARSGETCLSGICGSTSKCVAIRPGTQGHGRLLAGPDFGTTTADSTDGTGTAARFSSPRQACASPDGVNVFVTDGINHTIRQIVYSTGVVTTLAGTAGINGSTNATGAAARFSTPVGCVVDSTGANIYVAEFGNNMVRKVVVSTGVVTLVAGSGTGTRTDGTGAGASFNQPYGIAIDNAGNNLYVTEHSSNSVRQIVISSGVVTTLAVFSESVDLNCPHGIDIDSTDTYLYVANNACGSVSGNTIARINTSTGATSTIAGAGGLGNANATGSLLSMTFRGAEGIAVHPGDQGIYVSEAQGDRIRMLNLETGISYTISGSEDGSAGDEWSGSGTGSLYSNPALISIDATGSILYVADQSNNKIRKITQNSSDPS